MTTRDGRRGWDGKRYLKRRKGRPLVKTPSCVSGHTIYDATRFIFFISETNT